MDKDTIKKLRLDINDSLQKLESKYGMKIGVVGSMSYSANSFNCKIEGIESAESYDMEEAQFRKYCAQYGLEPEDYGYWFPFEGDMYCICGFKPKAKKYHFLIRNKAGKVYHTNSEVIKALRETQKLDSL